MSEIKEFAAVGVRKTIQDYVETEFWYDGLDDVEGSENVMGLKMWLDMAINEFRNLRLVGPRIQKSIADIPTK
jgi:hypothetical protein